MERARTLEPNKPDSPSSFATLMNRQPFRALVFLSVKDENKEEHYIPSRFF